MTVPRPRRCGVVATSLVVASFAPPRAAWSMAAPASADAGRIEATTTTPSSSDDGADDDLYSSVHLELDVSGLGEAEAGLVLDLIGPPLRDALQRRYRVPLRGDREPAEATLRLVFAFTDYMASDWSIEVEVIRGEVVDHVESIACRGCGAYTEVGERVLAALSGIVPRLEAPRAPVTTVDDAVVRDDGIATNDADLPVGDGRLEPSDPAPGVRPPLAAWAKVGASVLAGGVAAVVAGGVMVARGDEPDRVFGERSVGIDLRPPGLGLVIGGSLAAITGAVLIVVDRARGRARSHTAALAPAFGRHPLGFVFRRQF